MRIKERFLKLTAKSVYGTTDWRGIATISSGTTVVSVGGTVAKSGDVILTQAIQYSNALTGIVAGSDSGLAVARVTTIPISVGAGAFLIVTVGSVATANNLPVAWAVLR